MVELDVVAAGCGCVEADGCVDDVGDGFGLGFSHCLRRLLPVGSVVEEFVDEFVDEGAVFFGGGQVCLDGDGSAV